MGTRLRMFLVEWTASRRGRLARREQLLDDIGSPGNMGKSREVRGERQRDGMENNTCIPYNSSSLIGRMYAASVAYATRRDAEHSRRRT